MLLHPEIGVGHTEGTGSPQAVPSQLQELLNYAEVATTSLTLSKKQTPDPMTATATTESQGGSLPFFRAHLWAPLQGGPGALARAGEN